MKIASKIFQPFFSTKHNGEGTGLGLSLCYYIMKTKSVQSTHQWQSAIPTSYDIVKAHGGKLKVETKEYEGLPAGQAGLHLPSNYQQHKIRK